MLQDGTTRASPFGGHPDHTFSVRDLSDVEPIKRGVCLDNFASVCLVFVLMLSVMGVNSSACVNPRVGGDVCDCDELIKVALLLLHGQSESATKGGKPDPPPLPAMRIFVRKYASGKFKVTVSHAAESVGGSYRGLSAPVVDECGYPRTGNHTGGDKQNRPEEILVEASPINNFSKRSPLLSSQGSDTFKLTQTVASRFVMRHVHAPLGNYPILVQVRKSRTSTPVRGVARKSASKKQSGKRSYAPKKARAQQAYTRNAVQSLVEVMHVSQDQRATTSRHVTPTTFSSRARARIS